jgi:hypothetical protein
MEIKMLPWKKNIHLFIVQIELIYYVKMKSFLIRSHKYCLKIGKIF